MFNSPTPKFVEVAQSALRFDQSNPRFGGAAAGKSQDEIQALLEHPPHSALQLVDSLLENGYIDYEPLVVRAKDDFYEVVEGNRRLAAIRHILSNRSDYDGRSGKLGDLESIPVLVFPEIPPAQEKQDRRVYLGVRHLFGFREWPPESKARFLDGNIKTKADVDRTIRELNIKRQDVRRWLIPYRLRRKAAELWKPYQAEDFWMLGESLNRSGVKEYIGLSVDNETLTVKDFNEKRLQKLLEMIYGVPEGKKLVGRRVRETRDLTRLAKILQSAPATDRLEKGASIEQAEFYLEDLVESLGHLAQAVSSLGKVLGSVLNRTGGKAEARLVLDSYKAFERAATAFITNAKKSSV